MIGNDRVRFCEHCQIAVHNLDLTSRKQVRRLIARSEGRICISYQQPATERQTISPAPILHKIGRRTARIAAGAFSASLSISSAVAATAPLKQTAQRNEVVFAALVNQQFASSGTGALYGFVYDPNGAAIAGANVAALNFETNESSNTYTAGDGQYRLEGLKPGNYLLQVRSRGFDSSDIPNIQVRAGDNNRVDQTLSIAPITEEVTITAPDSDRVAIAGGGIISLPGDPLVKAARDDNLEELRTVLLSRSDANVRDKLTNSTALEYAVLNGNREMVQVLLWAKADVNFRDHDGQTVLMLLSDKVTAELVWDLINAGAKVNARDNDGDTPLISIAEVNNTDALKVLLDAGAKVNAANKEGETALMLAASSGFINNVRALIQAGADVNARDKQGKTALMLAIEAGEAAVVRLLKAHGAIEFEAPEKQ
ncbi:MAG TPA: ankyrin repeat domain-containing protein [Pyrinomonadaceae bacterium]|nr:ankyrin repeat domain-containing protein [Pyrinomonadaceae bacterium]